MIKTTLRNVKANVEVRELKDELSDAELKTVSGGTMLEALTRALGQANNGRTDVIKVMGNTKWGDVELKPPAR